jgi:Dyp-type peroxidase family
MKSMTSEEKNDIQGIIFSGYKHLYHSLYLFLYFNNAPQAKAWLKTVVPEITTANWDRDGVKQKPKKPPYAINLALTYAGLRTIGFPDEGLSKFSSEFISGMADPERARRLGDSDPNQWEIGGRNQNRIHALLILQASGDDDLNRLEKTYAAGLDLAKWTQRGLITDPNIEHFGFVDGISQPEIEESPRPEPMIPESARPFLEKVPKGEFILGYPNAYKMFPQTPTVPAASDVNDRLPRMERAPDGVGAQEKDFGKNGTYLVFRKLYQDVAAFRQFLRDNASADLPTDLLAAKLVGRRKNGEPLVPLSPNGGPPTPRNDFGYRATDPEGVACPIGSHIRRANPRDDLEHNPEQSLQTVSRHRILRRGAPYGQRLAEGIEKDDGRDRGLLFICLNADIRRQFEFVQQTWLNNPKFFGLPNDRDPLVGEGGANMTIQASPVRRRISGLPRFVTMRGGQYFFLPSISALRYLCELP